MTQHKRRAAGFTLVEILVTIGIIVVLAAILLPVFSRVRANARRSNCASNLRQLALATMMYTEDHNRWLPLAADGGGGDGKEGGWTYYSGFSANSVFDVTRGSLFPYVRTASLYICPGDTAAVEEVKQSYAINGCLTSPGASGFRNGRRLSRFNDISQWMLFSEEKAAKNTTDDAYQNVQVNEFSDRHMGGSNIVFLDSHVKWYKKSILDEKAFQTGGKPATTCP